MRLHLYSIYETACINMQYLNIKHYIYPCQKCFIFYQITKTWDPCVYADFSHPLKIMRVPSYTLVNMCILYIYGIST